MNIQILPNWCKKLGVVIFLIGVVSLSLDQFLMGWNYPLGNAPENSEINYFTNLIGGVFLSRTLGLLGTLIYLVSKEKIEDEYIKKMRSDVYQISVVILLFLSLIIYVFYPDFLIGIEDVIYGFWFVYLIVFSLKRKRA